MKITKLTSNGRPQTSAGSDLATGTGLTSMRLHHAEGIVPSTRSGRLHPDVWLQAVDVAWFATAAGVAILCWYRTLSFEPPVLDAHAYWVTSPFMPYKVSEMGAADAYHYSPAFLWAIELVKVLPWPVFRAIWEAGIITALAWLVGWRLLPVALLSSLFLADYAWGNIMILTAASLAVAFRYPAAYAFPILTKVST